MNWRAVTVSLLACAFLAPTSPSTAADPPASVTVRDPRIAESSGLVDLGDVWVTTNDSGDGARLFVLDPATGKTVGVTRFRADVTDVEALAPAGRGQVWVGDIGDNEGERRSVSVFAVKVAPGDRVVAAPRYRLVYPDRSHNAESLFVDPRGHLNVVTKSFAGGVVYRAPRPLSSTRPNRLTRVAKVAELATDAAMTPDGRHLLVRGPATAGVYTVPGFQRVASFPLPLQRQGEGISVGPTGRVRVSTEGAGTPIREVLLTAAVAQRIGAPAAVTPSPSPSPTPSSSPSSSPSPSPTPSPTEGPRPEQGAETLGGRLSQIDPPWLMWCIPGVLAVGAVGIGVGLRRRGAEDS